MRIYTHQDCIEHAVPPGHPERPERLIHLLRHLEDIGLTADYPLNTATEINDEMVNNAHQTGYLAQLAAGQPSQGIQALDADTWMGPNSLNAARCAAGAVWQGVTDVLSGKEQRVFCAVRPPGHHAELGTAMGFCLLNSVAIGAINALQLPGVDRVAILDFDVHHGNGTVDLCRGIPEILVCSSFQHPYYPGRLHDVLRPNIVNTPLPAGTAGDDFRRAIARNWWPAIERHAPDLFFLSAGFDGHRDDPLAQLLLDESDFSWITGEIVDRANAYAQGRIVSALEGGYDLEATSRSVATHLEALGK